MPGVSWTSSSWTFATRETNSLVRLARAACSAKISAALKTRQPLACRVGFHSIPSGTAGRPVTAWSQAASSLKLLIMADIKREVGPWRDLKQLEDAERRVDTSTFSPSLTAGVEQVTLVEYDQGEALAVQAGKAEHGQASLWRHDQERG